MHERRSFPRPPLWLNFLLLVLAIVTFAYARYERTIVKRKTALLFQPSPTNPEQINQIRQQLADMDLDRRQLTQELDGRMQYIQSLQGEQFYIAIDTAKQTLQFRIGKDVVREMPVTIGPAKTITAKDGRTWTFVPLKGGFNVEGKVTGYSWQVPDWVYAINGQSPPATPLSIENGLGKYILRLPNGYVIQSPPPAGGPLQGPKPGSYEVPEADLEAIWPRVTTDTRVYIF
jgi:hypothetical protein